MHKTSFDKLLSSLFILSILFGSMIAFAEPRVAISHIPTDIGKPTRPEDDPYKYYVSVAENFITARNHFSDLDSKTKGNLKSLSFNTEVNNSWEWGVDYLYFKQKYCSFVDDKTERTLSHDLVPYGTYFFKSDAYLTLRGGGRASYIKIYQNGDDGISTAKTSSGTGILGLAFGIWKDYGIWSPAIDTEVLYENTKTNKYTLTDGKFTPKEWIHFVQGKISTQLDVNMHENFQPYIKVGYQSILRRSKSYTIENWNGWLAGGGVNLFTAEKWNTYLDYEYSKMPTGDRQSSFMLKIVFNF